MGKTSEKQRITIEDQDQKQVDALENLKLKPIGKKQNQLSINLIISQELHLYLVIFIMKEKK